MRPARLGLVMTLFVTFAVSGSMSPAAAGLVNPKPVDPVIKLVPPRPAPHVPYTGDICPDGSPSCIEATITEMQQRLNVLAASCDHDAVFSLAYLRVTEDVRDAIAAGHFRDRIWLAQVDAVFAHDYFTAMDTWHTGDAAARASIPLAWQIALKAADDKAVSGLGNFMLAMNAHINRDFSFALAKAGLTGADGVSHKSDHDAYNRRLDALYEPVFAEEAARFDKRFDDIDVSTVEETAAGVIMRGWREVVWRNAEKLVLATSPARRAQAERSIEAYAAAQARMLRRMFTSGPKLRAEREAWCAVHHG